MKARLRAIWARLQTTRALRAWNRYNTLRGNRLAGAVTFYGFVSLFPLLVIAAAVGSAVAGSDGIETIQQIVDENLPGLGIEVEKFYGRAGTIGIIGAGTLLVTGLGWVDATRAAVRSMWGVDDQPGNVVTRKALDVASLAGLGVLLAASWGVSVLVGALAEDVLGWTGLNGTFSTAVLWVIGTALSIGVSGLLFAYLLAGLPRIAMAARGLVAASLLGAVAFEILKQFLVGFVTGPASSSGYAAFAAPLALLAWIYLVTRLLMFLAALTAEWAVDTLDDDEDAGAPGPIPATQPAPVGAGLTPRQVRGTAVAAGAVLGAMSTAVLVAVWRAARELGTRRPEGVDDPGRH